MIPSFWPKDSYKASTVGFSVPVIAPRREAVAARVPAFVRAMLSACERELRESCPAARSRCCPPAAVREPCANTRVKIGTRWCGIPASASELSNSKLRTSIAVAALSACAGPAAATTRDSSPSSRSSRTSAAAMNTSTAAATCTPARVAPPAAAAQAKTSEGHGAGDAPPSSFPG